MKQGRALMDEVLNCRPGEGEIFFWWLGQLGYLIRLGKLTLMIDAFLDADRPERLQPAMLQPEDMRDIDYILGTHDHDDHIDRKAWRVIAKQLPKVKFIVPSPLVADLAEELDLPQETISDAVRITLSGQRRAMVEHHRGLSGYTSECVEVGTDRGRVRILGTDLILRAMDRETLVVTGFLSAVEYG